MKANTQTFFTSLNSANYGFTVGEQSQWTETSNKTIYSWSGLISIGNLANSIASDGTLSVDFPAVGCGAIEFAPKSVEYISEGNYKWYGELKESNPCGCCEGYILLISQGGRKFGEATIGDRVFDIQSLSSSVSMLLELSTATIENSICGAGLGEANGGYSATISNPHLENTVNDRGGNPCNIVRIGVMATDAVTCDANEVAIKAIAQLNTAAVRSGILPSTLRFEKAGPVGYLPSTFVETNNPGADRNLFASSSQAIAYRAANEVDILVFLTEGNYSTSNGKILGITPSANVTVGPSALFSFCLVEADAAVPTKSFAHEVGHAMGGDHDCTDNPAVSCAFDGTTPDHGLIFFTNPTKPCCRFERSTIMAGSSKLEKRRILNFSNPVVNFSGVPTGNVDSDVATQLSDAVCIVSEFFPSPTSLTASIDAPIEVHTHSFSVTADVLGGTMPYSYDWAYSSDGVNYTTLISTASTVSIPNSWYGELGKNYVRLHVTDAVNEQEWAYGQVKSIPLFNGGGNDLKSANDCWTVFPNPASDFLDILPFVGLQNEPVEVWLVNERGQICKSTRFQFIGEKQQIDLKGLVTGKYTVHCMSRMTSFSKQVIVARP